ncbi:T9SS type A sorting domain-containing protein [Algibacter mikhailovii]|uniref:Secretion system C-terminal sorting domain-containing protein n=1 Tax=Algibacter mikhailovii TaxID=425498 RepID=A0A918V755_9FLAO|nr:T9SS type A sorting domain-containing protein [Algibacter mikhailovii]GGZ76217.1 hypothetical protein GCM10007028_12230 [Algibacter mikhailovii]
MKYFFTLTIFLIINNFYLFSQTDVVTGLNFIPLNIAFNGNELYMSSNAGEILKINITESTPTVTNVVSGLNFPYGLAFKGNELYISDIGEGKISKIDITETAPTITDVVTGLTVSPKFLAFNGNDLYLSGSGKISKIDITETTPTIIDVVTGSNHFRGITFNGSDLYVTDTSNAEILKIDITAITPSVIEIVTGLTSPWGLSLNGNELYFADFHAGKISKIDITATLPTVTDIVTNLTTPSRLAFNGNVLYFSQSNAGKISKIDVSTLSTGDLTFPKLLLFPNPANQFFQVSGLSKNEKYTLYNILGTAIKKGIISNYKQIDIKNLTNGLYFLKFDDNNTIEFIKK